MILDSIQFELDSESSDGSEDKDDSYKDSEEKEVSNSYQKNAKSIKDYGILEKENDISESDSDDLWTINGDTEEVAEGNYEDEKSEKKADFIDEREKFELEINESDSENEKLKDIRKTLIPSNDDDSSDRDEITSEKDDSILNPIKSAGRDYRIQKGKDNFDS